MITVFNNFANTTKPKYFEIDIVLESIRNCNVQKQIDIIRSEPNEDKKKKLKKMLPCILFAGEFTQRLDKAITKHSGFVILDWDKLTDIELKKKATIDKEKDSVQPAVINDDLIKEYYFQYNKENKIYGKND